MGTELLKLSYGYVITIGASTAFLVLLGLTIKVQRVHNVALPLI